MQQKRSLLFHERFERLRVSRQLSWKQLAEALGLSVGYLIMVNRGSRALSKRAQFRLEKLEQEAGFEIGPHTLPYLNGLVAKEPAPPPSHEDGIVLEAHDHEPRADDYKAGMTAEEALDRILRRNKTLYETLRQQIVAVERWDAQKRRHKRKR